MVELCSQGACLKSKTGLINIGVVVKNSISYENMYFNNQKKIKSEVDLSILKVSDKYNTIVLECNNAVTSIMELIDKKCFLPDDSVLVDFSGRSQKAGLIITKYHTEMLTRSSKVSIFSKSIILIPGMDTLEGCENEKLVYCSRFSEEPYTGHHTCYLEEYIESAGIGFPDVGFSLLKKIRAGLERIHYQML